MKSYGRTYLIKPVVLGFAIGAIGILLYIIPISLEIEEKFGLDLLFAFRGVQQPPDDVLIVSVDTDSADALNLPHDPAKWPRSIHAGLIDKLSAGGTSVIVFDVIFSERKTSGEDKLFSNSIRKAGNVVLGQRVITERMDGANPGKTFSGSLTVCRLLSPHPFLADSAAALAPFPIPKTPNKVSQYWTFSSAAGERPTLPVIALQIYAVEAHSEFTDLLRKAGLENERLSSKPAAPVNLRGTEQSIRELRHLFRSNPQLSQRISLQLKKETDKSSDKNRRLLKALAALYSSNFDSQYLNFYGPARTIRTVPYQDMLYRFPAGEVKGKAVFIGFSQLSPIDQRESFFTVYSQKNGLDLSGIELVATSFANLLENKPVRPVDFRLYGLIVLLWGMVLGFLSKRFSMPVSFFSILVLLAGYLAFAVYVFKTDGIWYPVVIPFFVQPALAFLGGLVWNYAEVKTERRNIRRALGLYLPDKVADELTKDTESMHSSHRIVFGTCLSTDAEAYATLSEMMEPGELRDFMNRYYEAIFSPIRRHGGTISDIKGDSALAIWISAQPEIALRKNACMAALDISAAIRRFNESEKFRLPTRIGLHSGNIFMGNVGAVDHFEYRPVGDIVNTATRIEGLNKYLGTTILAAREVVTQLDGFQTREMGDFILPGKKNPVKIFEITVGNESDEAVKDAFAIFQSGVEAFRRKAWSEAEAGFREVIRTLGSDGPSEFYLKLCRKYREADPGDFWDGSILIEKK